MDTGGEPLTLNVILDQVNKMNDKVNQIAELTLFLLLLMLSVVGARLLECFRTLRKQKSNIDNNAALEP